jgi:hypothetical protein
MNYKLSPSDLTFLYEGCKRCFYHKIINEISQPSIPLPAIFSKIAGLLKNHYNLKRTEELHSDLPPGTVKLGERYVESQNIRFPNTHNTCFIRGRFDIVIEFDDKTYGVIDFKTGNPESEFSSIYSRQLHAYAYALENPAHGALSLSPVSVLGLLYFYPTEIGQSNIEWLSYNAKIYLLKVKKDYKEFLTFMKEILSLLESPEIPNPAQDCLWCSYVNKMTKK